MAFFVIQSSRTSPSFNDGLLGWNGEPLPLLLSTRHNTCLQEVGDGEGEVRLFLVYVN